ncbi:MAG: hypothetical protein WCN98_12110 [Verrucomicrobiaceae bacterium]
MDQARLAPDRASVTLVVEPIPAGHRLYYVALLVNEIRAKGGRPVVLTTTSAAESSQWAIHLGQRPPETVTQAEGKFSLHDIAAISESFGARLTIIPNADHHLVSIIRQGWKGPGNLKLFIMRAEAAQPGPPLARMRPAKTVAKRFLICIAGLQPRVQVFALRNPLSRRTGLLHWVADPITFQGTSEQRDAMRQHLHAVSEDRYWLGVFGAINERKNLPLIVEAIINEPLIGLLIAGDVGPAVQAATNPLLSQFIASGGVVIQIAGPVNDLDFDSAIGAVDCVVVAQLTEGSSSIVLRAAALGRRLVLAGAKSLRRDAASLGDQAIWVPLDVGAIRRAVQRVRLLPDPEQKIQLNNEEFLKALT